MIVTRDSMTSTRMAVIGRRTGSNLIAGAKSMMILDLKRQMRNGVAHFVYQKRNGELREAWGTTCQSIANKHTNGNGCNREAYMTTAYFDVEKGAWRSFRWETLIAVY